MVAQPYQWMLARNRVSRKVRKAAKAFSMRAVTHCKVAEVRFLSYFSFAADKKERNSHASEGRDSSLLESYAECS